MNQACLSITTLVGWGAQAGLVLFCRYRNVPIGDFSFGNKSYFCKSTRDTLSCGFFATGFGERPSFPAILFYTDAQAIACHMHGVVEVVTAGIEFRKVRAEQGKLPAVGNKGYQVFHDSTVLDELCPSDEVVGLSVSPGDGLESRFALVCPGSNRLALILSLASSSTLDPPAHASQRKSRPNEFGGRGFCPPRRSQQ